MDDLNPITKWIELARAGDEDAAGELWRQYFSKLACLARGRMAMMSRGVYDEEDAALSAMHSFFRGMREQRFPQLSNRHNLWQLLTVITARKVNRRRAIDGSQKRGGGLFSEVHFEADLLNVIDHEPSPAFVTEMLDTLQARLDSLPNDMLRRVVLLTMDGLTQVEIAKALNCTVRTVHRKLEAIRAVWEDGEPGLSVNVRYGPEIRMNHSGERHAT